MKTTYLKAMAGIRISEGGYSNNPKDPGRATMCGITQATFDAYLKKLGLPTRPVKSITEAEIGAIYRTQYADKIRYDDLPMGVDYATLDAAVNSGVSRGAKWLQAAVGVKQDGAIGPATIAAAKPLDPIKVVKTICATRLSFLRGLTTFSTFGKGWTSRVARVEAEAVSMTLSTTSAKFAVEYLSDQAYNASDAADANKTNATATSVGAVTTSAGTGALTFDPMTIGLMAFVVVVLGVAAVYFIRQHSIHKARAAAYATAAAAIKG